MRSREEIEARIRMLKELIELTNRILDKPELAESTRQALENEWGTAKAVIDNLKWVLKKW